MVESRQLLITVSFYNMAQELLFSTTLKLRGPWLFETKQLLTLDEILERFRFKYPGPDGYGRESEKSLTVYLSRDRELKTSSFQEAISHIGSQDENAEGFEYAARTPNITALVQLARKKPAKKGEEEEPRFEITVSPKSSTGSYEIFMELKEWADSIAAPVWQQWILFEPRSLYRVILAFVVLIFLGVSLNSAPTTADYKEAVKQEARKLLQDGINPQNEARALELLLALQSDYIPPGIKPPQARRPIGWFLILIYVLTFLSFTPTVCIAIWAGRRRLRLWKFWMKLNTVTIPTLIFGHWISPQLFSTFEALLRH